MEQAGNSPQEEIKARLEVAQLYDEMGQQAKAARYYFAAAEIALRAKMYSQGKTLLEKTLALEPGDAQAKAYLDKLDAHLASKGGAGVATAKVENRADGNQGLTVPTPALYLRKDQISAILAQVASAPNAKFFPYAPLPKFEQSAIEARAKVTEAKREGEREKNRTAVESSFGSGRSSFSSDSGGILNRAGSRPRSRGEEQPEDDKGGRSRRASRADNQDLAQSIIRRMHGG